MTTLEIKIPKGTNRWSIRRTYLIQMRSYDAEKDTMSSNQFQGFTKRLSQHMPLPYGPGASYKGTVGSSGVVGWDFYGQYSPRHCSGRRSAAQGTAWHLRSNH